MSATTEIEALRAKPHLTLSNRSVGLFVRLAGCFSEPEDKGRVSQLERLIQTLITEYNEECLKPETSRQIDEIFTQLETAPTTGNTAARITTYMKEPLTEIAVSHLRAMPLQLSEHSFITFSPSEDEVSRSEDLGAANASQHEHSDEPQAEALRIRVKTDTQQTIAPEPSSASPEASPITRQIESTVARLDIPKKEQTKLQKQFQRVADHIASENYAAAEACLRLLVGYVEKNKELGGIGNVRTLVQELDYAITREIPLAEAVRPSGPASSQEKALADSLRKLIEKEEPAKEKPKLLHEEPAGIMLRELFTRVGVSLLQDEQRFDQGKTESDDKLRSRVQAWVERQIKNLNDLDTPKNSPAPRKIIAGFLRQLIQEEGEEECVAHLINVLSGQENFNFEETAQHFYETEDVEFFADAAHPKPEANPEINRIADTLRGWFERPRDSANNTDTPPQLLLNSPTVTATAEAGLVGGGLALGATAAGILSPVALPLAVATTAVGATRYLFLRKHADNMSLSEGFHEDERTAVATGVRDGAIATGAAWGTSLALSALGWAGTATVLSNPITLGVVGGGIALGRTINKWTRSKHDRLHTHVTQDIPKPDIPPAELNTPVQRIIRQLYDFGPLVGTQSTLDLQENVHTFLTTGNPDGLIRLQHLSPEDAAQCYAATATLRRTCPELERAFQNIERAVPEESNDDNPAEEKQPPRFARIRRWGENVRSWYKEKQKRKEEAKEARKTKKSAERRAHQEALKETQSGTNPSVETDSDESEASPPTKSTLRKWVDRMNPYTYISDNIKSKFEGCVGGGLIGYGGYNLLATILTATDPMTTAGLTALPTLVGLGSAYIISGLRNLQREKPDEKRLHRKAFEIIKKHRVKSGIGAVLTAAIGTCLWHKNIDPISFFTYLENYFSGKEVLDRAGEAIRDGADQIPTELPEGSESTPSGSDFTSDGADGLSK